MHNARGHMPRQPYLLTFIQKSKRAAVRRSAVLARHVVLDDIPAQGISLTEPKQPHSDSSLGFSPVQ